jgi:signal-transduction protein with cAMP-binding, CBS, and nucleotidyltransferase domain
MDYLEIINVFKTIGEKLTYNKNEFLVKENQVCNFLGVVETGSLISYFEDDNCDIIINELYSTGFIISSYRSFITGVPSPGYIKAYTKSVIYTINREQYVLLCKDLKWLSIFKDIADSLFVNKCSKETSLIKLKAKDRYKELIARRADIEQAFPQHIIASYLKIRPETLSRLKKP